MRRSQLIARTRVKICCISSAAELHAAVAAGADAIGLVGAMPSGPGVIDTALARELAAQVPPPVAAVLLTAHASGAAIARHAAEVGANVVQVVRHIEPDEHRGISRRLPHLRRLQVIHVGEAAAHGLVADYEAEVDGFLLDSGRPQAAVPELGGTGRVHDWRISADIVRETRRPVLLAGGLTPENVGDAIAAVQPFGVDVCSGVRTNGELDPRKLRAFMRAVRDVAPR